MKTLAISLFITTLCCAVLGQEGQGESANQPSYSIEGYGPIKFGMTKKEVEALPVELKVYSKEIFLVLYEQGLSSWAEQLKNICFYYDYLLKKQVIVSITFDGETGKVNHVSISSLVLDTEEWNNYCLAVKVILEEKYGSSTPSEKESGAAKIYQTWKENKWEDDAGRRVELTCKGDLEVAVDSKYIPKNIVQIDYYDDNKSEIENSKTKAKEKL